jgi:hypothetical protein
MADDDNFYDGLGPATDHLPRGDHDFFVAPTTTDGFDVRGLDETRPVSLRRGNHGGPVPPRGDWPALSSAWECAQLKLV